MKFISEKLYTQTVLRRAIRCHSVTLKQGGSDFDWDEVMRQGWSYLCSDVGRRERERERDKTEVKIEKERKKKEKKEREKGEQDREKESAERKDARKRKGRKRVSAREGINDLSLSVKPHISTPSIFSHSSQPDNSKQQTANKLACGLNFKSAARSSVPLACFEHSIAVTQLFID